jgi:hypothetical protein
MIPGLPKVDGRIFFGVPCHDHRIDVDCMLSIYRKVSELPGSHTYFHKGISDVALARNIVAHRFMKSDCEWWMFVDSDIYFTDLDWQFLWEGDEDIVTAPYARKIPGVAPCEFGLGFTRVHRRVFEAIERLETDNGSEMAQRFYLDGEIHTHFFPNGVSGDSRWHGEDRGFFILCALTGTPYRIEKRCRLGHGGRFVYGYPNQDGGVQFWVGESETDDYREEGDGRPVVIM